MLSFVIHNLTKWKWRFLAWNSDHSGICTRYVQGMYLPISSGFSLVWLYGISNIVGYLIWFGLVLWHINHCRLFSLVWFGLVLWYINHYRLFSFVWFYGISTIVGYLVWFGLAWLYGISIIVDYLIWFGLVLWHISHCSLFNGKSCLCIYIKYIWFVNTLRWLVWFGTNSSG